LRDGANWHGGFTVSDQGHHTDYAELRADLAEASNAVEIAAALGKHTPPSDRVKREIVRGLLKRTIGERLKAVGDKGTSATGLTDAWLKSSNGDGADLQGEAFKPDEVEAWGEPVDLGEVLDEAVAAISRYLYAPEASIDVIALWCAYTYAYDEFDVSPILDVFSPTKRCGKTTALTCVRRLAREAMMAGNISPAALTRSVSAWHPTLIADEADTFAVANDEIRGIYNSGHTRETAYVVRAEGDNNEPRMLNTYSPKAIGCIGHLPDTIRDRAVTVELRRKPTTAEREDANDVKATRAVFDPIRARLVRAVADVVTERGTTPSRCSPWPRSRARRGLHGPPRPSWRSPTRMRKPTRTCSRSDTSTRSCATRMMARRPPRPSCNALSSATMPTGRATGRAR
jgi:hypothetical protein